MEIYKVFTIDVAHSLPAVPEGHKCSRVHGHTFRIEIHLNGPVDSVKGWVMDFAEITARFQPVQQRLDHKYLNNIEGLENPTSENLAQWIWRELQATMPYLSKIVVQESPESGCIYCGEGSGD